MRVQSITPASRTRLLALGCIATGAAYLGLLIKPPLLPQLSGWKLTTLKWTLLSSSGFLGFAALHNAQTRPPRRNPPTPLASSSLPQADGAPGTSSSRRSMTRPSSNAPELFPISGEVRQLGSIEDVLGKAREYIDRLDLPDSHPELSGGYCPFWRRSFWENEKDEQYMVDGWKMKAPNSPFFYWKSYHRSDQGYSRRQLKRCFELASQVTDEDPLVLLKRMLTALPSYLGRAERKISPYPVAKIQNSNVNCYINSALQAFAHTGMVDFALLCPILTIPLPEFNSDWSKEKAARYEIYRTKIEEGYQRAQAFQQALRGVIETLRRGQYVSHATVDSIFEHGVSPSSMGSVGDIFDTIDYLGPSNCSPQERTLFNQGEIDTLIPKCQSSVLIRGGNRHYTIYIHNRTGWWLANDAYISRRSWNQKSLKQEWNQHKWIPALVIHPSQEGRFRR